MAQDDKDNMKRSEGNARGWAQAWNRVRAAFSGKAAEGEAAGAAGKSGERQGNVAATVIAKLFGAGAAQHLAPMVKRKMFTDFPDIPAGVTLGWAQLPQLKGKAFSIGLFTDSSHFLQIALADDQGKVYLGNDLNLSSRGMRPAMSFVKTGESELEHGKRLGTLGKLEQTARLGQLGRLGADGNRERSGKRNADTAFTGQSGKVPVIQGKVVAVSDDDDELTVATWIKHAKRYSLEDMRLPLPDSMRLGLEYRDALAVAFFNAFMIPGMQGRLFAAGSDNIVRHLDKEAPISGIRNALDDVRDARSHGMRVSGVEDYFQLLMREVGADQQLPGLEAMHGAEPMHMVRSAYSENYQLAWQTPLPFDAALSALRIEGNINRFMAVRASVENNERSGKTPTEDTISCAQAALIDQRLLRNPALDALRATDGPADYVNLLEDDGFLAVNDLNELAKGVAKGIAKQQNQFTGAPDALDGGASEWLFRQTMTSLMVQLRVPYRFDTLLRSNIAQGKAALAFTAISPSLMPESYYDASSGEWVTLTMQERSEMSVDYNLRIGMIMAALAFGAEDNLTEFALRIDSIGLEEAIAQQDNAIKKLMGEAFNDFELLRTSESAAYASKADPKDGDIHGDPDYNLADTSGEVTLTPSQESQDAQLDEEFERLIQGAQIDETVFSTDDRNSSRNEDGEYADNAMDELNAAPNVVPLVTAIFHREEFLDYLEAHGLEDPREWYGIAGARMDINEDGYFATVEANVDLSDPQYSPHAAQEEPESSNETLSNHSSRILGAHDTYGLAIQREDLLSNANLTFHSLAAREDMPSVEKAQEAMRLVERIADPELTELAPSVTSALIDGEDTPQLEFTLTDKLERERAKARDQLFSGQVMPALDTAQHAVEELDQVFASAPGVPRYFNSYAERVVYNHLFATEGEQTVLIPDELFYAHMELADMLTQFKDDDSPLTQLNTMVSYAPAYPLSHLKLAAYFTRMEDWQSVRAACLNALRVSLDADDASYAYYRLAQAAWMMDDFDIAAAAYIMCNVLAPGKEQTFGKEMAELFARARSQSIRVPENMVEAMQMLARNDIPVWPNTKVGELVRQAARVSVDDGMFVPARTLALAVARMNGGASAAGMDAVQMQFLRSLT